MGLSSFLIMLVVACGIWVATSAVLITAALDRRGMRTPFPFIGLFLFRNLGRYREITLRETGKVGLLYYSYIVAINTALAFALIALGFISFLLYIE